MLCDAAACISLDLPIQARKKQMELKTIAIAKQREEDIKLSEKSMVKIKPLIDLEVGDRVEVRDGDEEWEIGTVKSFDDIDEDDTDSVCQVEGIRIRGIPRVKKDGFDTAYTWDEFRMPPVEENDEEEDEGDVSDKGGDVSDKGGDVSDKEEEEEQAFPQLNSKNEVNSFVDTEKKVRRMLEEQRLSPVVTPHFHTFLKYISLVFYIKTHATPPT